MVDRDLNDVYKKLAELPLRRFAEVLRNKAMDLVSQLGQPAYFDQYPSKQVPWIFSRTYGPIPLTSTRTLAPSEVLASGTATAGGAFTLTDAPPTWTVDEFAGFTVTITAGAGSGRRRRKRRRHRRKIHDLATAKNPFVNGILTVAQEMN